MATGEGSMAGTEAGLAGLAGLAARLQQEVQQAGLAAGEVQVCVQDPTLAPAGEYTGASLRGVRLALEGELEALMATPLVRLPDSPPLLQALAGEHMQRAALHNARTLDFYKKKLEELKERHRKYESMVQRATQVHEALARLLTQYYSAEAKRVALERSHSKMAVLFRSLRAEMHFLLETLYPDEISTPESVRSMEDLLDCLVSRMMSDPSDPYVEIDDSMEEAHLTLLLCANLIARHPSDITRIKFIDPRA